MRDGGEFPRRRNKRRKRILPCGGPCLLLAAIALIAPSFVYLVYRSPPDTVTSTWDGPPKPSRRSNHARECRLAPLLEALRLDPERNAVRPVGSFPGLNQKSLSILRGKRVALVGDSTLWYFTKWLDVLLNEERYFKWQVDLDNMNLATAQDLVLLSAIHACQHETFWNSSQSCTIPTDGMTNPTPIRLRDGTHIQWAGMAGFNDHLRTENLLHAMWKDVKSIRPQVVVANMGLHWLHFYNIARNTSAEAIDRWIHYEQWLEQVYSMAESLNVRVLLFKTTNRICDRKLYDVFRDANVLYNARDQSTVENCLRALRSILPLGSSVAANDYCVNGTINNKGVEQLNQRLRAFVTKKLLHKDAMLVDIFDDNAIQQCRHSPENDGLHYHASNLMRVRLLVNQLSCVL